VRRCCRRMTDRLRWGRQLGLLCWVHWCTCSPEYLSQAPHCRSPRQHLCVERRCAVVATVTAGFLFRAWPSDESRHHSNMHGHLRRKGSLQAAIAASVTWQHGVEEHQQPQQHSCRPMGITPCHAAPCGVALRCPPQQRRLTPAHAAAAATSASSVSAVDFLRCLSMARSSKGARCGRIDAAKDGTRSRSHCSS
jgi:hypothetical protein